jgi:large subunit ribosomal protein L28
MGRECEVCKKTLSSGNRIVRHGLAKAKGGIGLHTTGITRRKFLPNLQRIRVMENGGVTRKTVCTACIRSNKIVKG